jgi:glycosyltransferase involved in cell wall biosynthesis
MLKVAVITCYKDPDYVRARSLRAALQLVPGVQMLVLKNKHHNLFLRLPEIAYRLAELRRNEQPDVYLLTFRGYELLPLVLLLAGRRPVIFDEFIQPVEVVAEHQSMKRGSAVAQLMGVWKLLAPLYYLLLKRCHTILTDTEAHAEYASSLSRVDRSKYLVLPVGTDEALFRPPKRRTHAEEFQVFFYGNMVPLHGIRYVIEAAERLKKLPHITFFVVGGDAAIAHAVERAVANGAHITYEPWVPFDELPHAIAAANLCLGGPFGDTVQSHNVVTGKTYQFLACGAPTMVGKSKATAELFRDKQNCLVVQQASADDLARAVLWAQAHPDELAEIGKQGRALYEAHFSAKQIAKTLRRIILPLVRVAANDPSQAESPQTTTPKTAHTPRGQSG